MINTDAMSLREVRELIGQLDIIELAEVAKIIGVDYQTAKSFRSNTGQCRPDVLPDPLPLPGRSPLYLRKEILEWARQTGRVDEKGNPTKPPQTARAHSTHRPRGGEEWLKHLKQIAHVKKWAEETGYPGGPHKAIMDLWGVSRATGYTWLKEIRENNAI